MKFAKYPEAIPGATIFGMKFAKYPEAIPGAPSLELNLLNIQKQFQEYHLWNEIC